MLTSIFSLLNEIIKFLFSDKEKIKKPFTITADATF